MSDTAKNYRDRAIVLRTHKLGEADRIITALSQYHGLVRAVAKGVRRTSSRIGARVEPFNVIDCQFHRGRSLDVISQVVTVSAYSEPLALHYELFTTASVMVEASEKLAEQGESTPALYALLYGALHALATRAHDDELVLASFLLRAMALAGWAPTFNQCAACGADGPHPYFSIPAGGALCENCHSGGAMQPDPQILELSGLLLEGNWQGVEQGDRFNHKIKHAAATTATNYAQWHLERRLKSVPIRERGSNYERR